MGVIGSDEQGWAVMSNDGVMGVMGSDGSGASNRVTALASNNVNPPPPRLRIGPPIDTIAATTVLILMTMLAVVIATAVW
jgi:hypothetical protein